MLRLLAFLAVPTFAAESPRSASFVNDVVPMLTKSGCNSGACHAKAGMGQNGFQLSLLGFEPQEDYDHLVKEARGRRVSAASPEESLLLRKASNRTPHGGGLRLDPESPEYRALRDWLAQGLRFDQATAPKLVALDVQPPRAKLAVRGEQQLTVPTKIRACGSPIG